MAITPVPVEPPYAPAVDIPSTLTQLYNLDLAPTQPEGRTWGTFSLFAMWMSDVHSVGGYTFAASLFFLGLAGWQVLLSMTAGITLVYFLMNLIGRPSQKYGIPFPVVARLSFGVMGANLAATVRGIVGIVWYGVQTYFASKAVQVLVITLMPSAAELTHTSLLGLSTLGWMSFAFMWFFQLVIFLAGMETIRKFIDFCGPVIYLVMFVLALRYLGTARTGAYFSTAPFVGAALSLFVFREIPEISFWVAGGLMAIGVWLHVSEHHEHDHQHEAMAHEHKHVHDEHHQHEHDFPWDGEEPHSHPHEHEPLAHSHPHFPDTHHRHGH